MNRVAQPPIEHQHRLEAEESQNAIRDYTTDVDAAPPLPKMVFLGVQHVTITLASYITMPLLIAGGIGLSAEVTTQLIAFGIFAGGLACFIQSFGIGRHIGSQLPVVLGCSAVALAPLIAAGKAGGLPLAFGSVIASGIIVLALSPFIGKMMKFFPPIVVGTITTLIGLVLIPMGVNLTVGYPGEPNFATPSNVILGLATILVIVVLNRFLKGFMQALAVLLGIVTCTLGAAIFGLVDPSGVASASWFSVPMPFAFGIPQFTISAILPFFIVCIANMMESVGSYFAVGAACNVVIDDKRLVRAFRGEGIASVAGGVLNSFTYTSYIQNVALVTLTKVVSRFVVVAAAVIFMVLGLVPKFSALGTMIPGAVMGGANIVLFAMVVVAGINILAAVDFSDNRNGLIFAVSIGLGLGTAAVPGFFSQSPQIVQDILGDGGIALGCLLCIVLNAVLFFPEIFGKNEIDKTTEIGSATDLTAERSDHPVTSLEESK